MIANPDQEYDLEDPNAPKPAAAGPAAPAAPPPPPAAPPAPSATPYNREQFRDQWMGTGTNVGAQNTLLSQYGLSADAAGRVALPQDVNGHSGETLDLRIGAKSGQNLAGWTDIGQNGGGGGASGGGAAGVAGSVSGAAGSTGGFQGSVREMLMKFLNGANGPVDENSTEIRQPFDAAKLQAERGSADERSALAERLYAEGGGGTNELAQGVMQGKERMAVGLGGIKAQLIQRATQAKQQQLQQALSLAVQSGDSEAARAIQLQIAQMGNALGYSQLNQQQGQWNDQYGLNKAIYKQNQNNYSVNELG